MSMVIAMPGLPVPGTDEGAAARDLPPMDALASLLARGRPLPPCAHWRAGVLAAIGMPAAAGISDVAVAACALPGIAEGAALCFVSPLHLVAGISRVHLPPGGWPALDADESARWVDAFNREFGAPGLRLHDAAGGWLLAADFAQAAQEAAPGQLLGSPLARAPAVNEGARALRRLGAEAEIWLASHPLNRERESRQRVPLNSLWFWGGGRAMVLPRPATVPAAMVMGGEIDPWTAGLAAACKTALRHAARWNDIEPIDGTLLVLHERTGPASMQHWQWLEECWFAPLARALRAARVPALHLQIGGRAWRLPDRSPLRWLRRRRPWYQQVAA